MLDNLRQLFRKELQYAHTAGVLQQIGNLINIVQAQYMKDGDAKNAAIDAMCELLQSHKDAPAVEQPHECTQECTNATS